MDKIFDFGDRAKSEDTIKRTWNEFRVALAMGKFNYNQVDDALNETHLRVFNDMFSNHNFKVRFSVSLSDLVNCQGVTFCRGAKLNSHDPVPYERFVPNKDYINDDNRFSPPGIEWLYLALQETGMPTVGSFSMSEKCCIDECRATNGDYFAICDFMADITGREKNIVDLTIANNYSYDELNKEFEEAAKKYKNQAVKEILTTGKYTSTGKQEFVEDHLYSWVAYTYAKLMAEQIFLPVDTGDKKLLYSPFQCMAQYFINQGFDGLIYGSTVCPNAKNIVLFDKSYATPSGTIRYYQL